MSQTTLNERDVRRETLLEEVELSRLALNKTITGLKTNLQPSHLVGEAAQPIIAQTNVAIDTAKAFVRANPLLSISATTAALMALTASARSYRNSDQVSNGKPGNAPTHVKARGVSNYFGRLSSNVLDRASGVSTNLVQEAASVVKNHINDRTSSAETAALGIVRGITQTAVAAAETMLLSKIANALRARTNSTRANNRRDGDDEY